MKVSRELLEQMFCLGDRHIVGVAFEHLPYAIEPTAIVRFDIEAPDAPDGTTEMEPTLERDAGGIVRMISPGWRTS